MSASYDLATLQANLENSALIKRGAKLVLIPYDPAFPRRPGHQRWHYRVESECQPICHLVVGMNLAQLHRKADEIFTACPELICRSLLFWELADGTGHLCLEHFAGESLESAVKEGRCSAEEWLRLVRHAQGLLSRTEKPSDEVALHREIRLLSQEVSRFPGFTDFDARIVHELGESILSGQASFEPLTTRWSNGDFIGRNLLIKPDGTVRMIDYEHAQRTHFWRSDWLRLTQFSQLPQGLKIHTISEVTVTDQPWQKIHFWLFNLWQLGEAEPCEAVKRHVAAITREFFRSVARAALEPQFKNQQSFLLKTLTTDPVEEGSFVETARDERYRERKIREDLHQANFRLQVTERELSRQEIALRTEKGIHEQTRSNFDAQVSKADHFRCELIQAQRGIDLLLRASASKENLTDSGKISYGIDRAEASFTVSDKLSLTGWITGTGARASRVRLRLDQGDIFDCSISELTPDAASSTAPHWKAAFSLQAYVPVGLHVATLEYGVPLSQDWVPFCTRSLLVDFSPLFLRLEQSIPAIRPSGQCEVRGWCFHPQDQIESISVRHGTTTASLAHGMPRADVGGLYPWNQSAQHCGFSGTIDLLPSRDDVVLTVVLRNGAILREIIARGILVSDVTPGKAAQASAVTLDATAPAKPALCRLNEVLHFGPPETISPFLRFGWHESENNLRWPVGSQAGLRFRFSPDEVPHQVKISVHPLIVSDQVTRQRIYVELPHNVVPHVVELTRNEPQEVIFHLPRSAWSSDNILDLQFTFPDARRPEDIGLSKDNRLLSVAFSHLVFHG